MNVGYKQLTLPLQQSKIMSLNLSLDTLLEAARYVEQQEMQAAQAQLITIPPLTSPVQQQISPVHQSVITLRESANAQTITHVINHTKHVQDVIKLSPISTPTAVIETNGFSKPITLITEENGHGIPITEQKQRITSTGSLRSGTREVHNKLEKNRRAHLKECFELLKKQLPPQQDEKKSSNLSILHSALRYIQILKKKERENEHEMERLAREKISAQQRLAALKKELGVQWDNIDFNNLISDVVVPKDERGIEIERNRSTKENGRVEIENRITAIQAAQVSVQLPLQQVVSQGLVVGLHKVALVSKSLPLVSSPVTHIITAPPQFNGKVVPLVNAQYLMKPVVVVSTPSAAGNALSPPPS